MSIDNVRLIIADPEQYDRAEATGNGATLEFRVPHFPMKESSVKVYVGGILQTITVDYTLEADVGLVTMVAAPGAGVAVVVTYRHSLLTDTNIQSFLTIESSNVKRAAAMALETIASSETLIQKKIRLLDLTTDGPAVAVSLREHAARLRKQADDEDVTGAFDIAEMVVDDFTLRERIYKEALRGG